MRGVGSLRVGSLRGATRSGGDVRSGARTRGVGSLRSGGDDRSGAWNRVLGSERGFSRCGVFSRCCGREYARGSSPVFC